MENIDEEQGSQLPVPPPTMDRLPGSADARGTDYEFKMAALLALRLRRRGARFQMFSNAGAALPFDDLVVRVLAPAPALLAIQLKHKHSGKQLTSQAFTSSSGDFALHKYFKLYKEMHGWHDPQRQAPLTADQQLLCATPLQDVWFVIYTPAALRGAAKRPAPAAQMPFEDVLHTDARGRSVWGCMSQEAAEVQELFQRGFLPRLRLLCHQATVEQLDALLEEEVNAAFGQPLPRADWLTEQLLRRFKAWAQDNPAGAAVADVTALLGEVVGEDLRRAG
ncbi:Ankyrin-2, partial [Gryllus bimaculatus]